MLLMAEHKKGDSRICVKMWDMPASEDRASEARMGVTTAANSGMEMGEHNHGLCNQIAKEQKG